MTHMQLKQTSWKDILHEVMTRDILVLLCLAINRRERGIGGANALEEQGSQFHLSVCKQCTICVIECHILDFLFYLFFYLL